MNTRLSILDLWFHLILDNYDKAINKEIGAWNERYICV